MTPHAGLCFVLLWLVSIVSGVHGFNISPLKIAWYKSSYSLTSTQSSAAFGSNKFEDAVLQNNRLRQLLETKSPCERNVAMALIQDCASYDGLAISADHQPRLSREDLQKIFAIRTTACQMNEAGSSMPSECGLILSVDQSTNHLLATLPTCLEAMLDGGHTQANNLWVTYTNIHTTALQLCLSYRSEHDRDRQLHEQSLVLDHMNAEVETVTNILQQLTEISEHLHHLKDDVNAAQKKASGDITTQLTEMNTLFQAFGSLLKTNEGALTKLSRDVMANTDSLEISSSRINEIIEQLQGAGHDVVNRLNHAVDQSAVSMAKTFDHHAHSFELALQNVHQYVADVGIALEQAQNSAEGVRSSLEVFNTGLQAQTSQLGQLNHDLASYHNDQQAVHNASQEALAQLYEDTSRILATMKEIGQHLDNIAAVFRATALSLGWLCRLLFGSTENFVVFASVCFTILMLYLWIGRGKQIYGALLLFTAGTLIYIFTDPLTRIAKASEKYPFTTCMLPVMLACFILGLALGLVYHYPRVMRATVPQEVSVIPMTEKYTLYPQLGDHYR